MTGTNVPLPVTERQGAALERALVGLSLVSLKMVIWAWVGTGTGK